MEQFSLEKYLANPSRKVVTRDGRRARIVCTDKRGLKYPILALVENKFEEIETAVCYTEGGKLYSNDTSNADLFFAPEKHEGWINLYKDIIYNTKAEAEDRLSPEGCYLTTIKIEWEE